MSAAADSIAAALTRHMAGLRVAARAQLEREIAADRRLDDCAECDGNRLTIEAHTIVPCPLCRAAEYATYLAHQNGRDL